MCQKSDTFINYVNIMSYKLQNTFEQFQHLLLLIHTVMCSLCPPCCCTTQPCFSQCAVVHHAAGEFICTDDTKALIPGKQSFTKNAFTVIRAAYFCPHFNENNASFAHTRDANRNHHVMQFNKDRKLKYQKGVTFLAHTVRRNKSES